MNDSKWWRLYPKGLVSPTIKKPRPDDSPKFQVGDRVRLKDKPDKVRCVLGIDWHCFRGEFVFVVETSCPFCGNMYRPYWFATQLILENDWQKAVLQNPSKTDWLRIDSLKDEDIDTSDTPLLDDDFFARAKILNP